MYHYEHRWCLWTNSGSRLACQVEPLMIDHLDELVSWCFEPSQPQRVISGLTTLMKDHFGKRPPWWKTTMMKDNFGEQSPWWKTTLVKDHLDERHKIYHLGERGHDEKSLSWKIAQMKDHFGERPLWWLPWWKTTMMKDHPSFETTFLTPFPPYPDVQTSWPSFNQLFFSFLGWLEKRISILPNNTGKTYAFWTAVLF